MDRQEFINGLDIAKEKVDPHYLYTMVNRSIETSIEEGKFVGFNNLLIAGEELSELNQEVSKYLRDKGDYYNILQELADVTLCTEYIKRICKIDETDLQKAVNVKLTRLENKLNKDGVYK